MFASRQDFLNLVLQVARRDVMQALAGIPSTHPHLIEELKRKRQDDVKKNNLEEKKQIPVLVADNQVAPTIVKEEKIITPPKSALKKPTATTQRTSTRAQALQEAKKVKDEADKNRKLRLAGIIKSPTQQQPKAPATPPKPAQRSPPATPAPIPVREQAVETSPMQQDEQSEAMAQLQHVVLEQERKKRKLLKKIKLMKKRIEEKEQEQQIAAKNPKHTIAERPAVESKPLVITTEAIDKVVNEMVEEGITLAATRKQTVLQQQQLATMQEQLHRAEKDREMHNLISVLSKLDKETQEIQQRFDTIKHARSEDVLAVKRAYNLETPQSSFDSSQPMEMHNVKPVSHVNAEFLQSIVAYKDAFMKHMMRNEYDQDMEQSPFVIEHMGDAILEEAIRDVCKETIDVLDSTAASIFDAEFQVRHSLQES